MKIAIFSDIHFGKNKDAEYRLLQGEQYVDWFIKVCKENKVTEVFFLGDWFDNRYSISVQTFVRSYNCLKKVAMEFPTTMIVGNHDMTLKSSMDITSVKVFEEIENVTVIDTPTVKDYGGKNFLFYPYGFDLTEYIKRDDIAASFGHFEFNGAALVGHVHQGSKFTLNEVSKISPITFSGHFHVRKEYPTEFGNVVTVGCPFQLDWGDCGNYKGVYILDSKSLHYDFVENDDSAVYYKYFWSRLKSGAQEIDKDMIKNNFIKLIVDDDYIYPEVSALVEDINHCGPYRPCVTDFIFNNYELTTDDIDVITGINITGHFDYVTEFINNSTDDKITRLDKQRLIEFAKTYYERGLINE